MFTSLLVMVASLLACMALLQRRGLSLGLPLAFLGSLLLLHAPGGLVHALNPGALPGYVAVEKGLAITAWAAVLFTVGVGLFHLQGRLSRRAALWVATNRLVYRLDRPFWRFCLTWGLGAAFLLTPLRRFPTLGALITGASLLWIPGVLLAVRYFARTRQLASLGRWTLAAFIQPAYTLLGAGFLGYGVSSLINVFAVLLVAPRRWLRSVAIATLVAYLGLSVVVAYLEGRSGIREAVWGGEVLEQRLNAVATTFASIAPFDPTNLRHAELIDSRLNQNFLVGMAAGNIEQGTVQLLGGQTVVDSITALIPRVLWLDKPVVGGSGDLVTRVTGIPFAEGTSVGVGNVLESYINFGMAGVAAFFLAIGYGLAWLDCRAFLAEQQGHHGALLQAVLPALALIQPGGSFTELTSSAVAAWLASLLWTRLWRQSAARRMMQPAG